MAEHQPDVRGEMMSLTRPSPFSSVTTDRHDTIEVVHGWFRWKVTINGEKIARYWRRDEAVIMGNFLARLAAPSTLVVTPGPGQPIGERREFG